MQDGLKRVLDYSDYLETPEDGRRYEILCGDLLVTPAPRPVHQRILLRLASALREYFEPRTCEVFVAPVDLILTEHDVLQPDLLVVDDPAVVTQRGIEGAPLLVAEVLSPTTSGRDRGVKARRYAQQGVRHYWLVDPDVRQIEFHRLAEGAYERVVAQDVGDKITTPDFPGLTLSHSRLWAESATSGGGS